MDPFKISIEKATNGFIITYPDIITGENGYEEVLNSYVIQEQEGEFAKQEAFVQLCRELMDKFGIYNSKHNKRRINIELEENLS